MHPIVNAIQTALGMVKSASFASFTYEKSSGEIAKYQVILGVDWDKVNVDDLATLKALEPTLTGIDLEACHELIESLQDSVDNGRGNNPRAKSAQAYTSIEGVKGLKIHDRTGNLHVMCLVQHKTILRQGKPSKPVNSKPLTIAKDNLRSQLRAAGRGQFILQNMSRAALVGEVLELS